MVFQLTSQQRSFIFKVDLRVLGGLPAGKVCTTWANTLGNRSFRCASGFAQSPRHSPTLLTSKWGDQRPQAMRFFTWVLLSSPLASGWLLDYSSVVPQGKMPQTILKILGTCEPAKDSPACSLVSTLLCWGIPLSTFSASHFFPLFWEASSPFSLL